MNASSQGSGNGGNPYVNPGGYGIGSGISQVTGSAENGSGYLENRNVSNFNENERIGEENHQENDEENDENEEKDDNGQVTGNEETENKPNKGGRRKIKAKAKTKAKAKSSRKSKAKANRKSKAKANRKSKSSRKTGRNAKTRRR